MLVLLQLIWNTIVRTYALGVYCSPAKGPKATGRRTAAAVAAGAIAATGKAAVADAIDDGQLVSLLVPRLLLPLASRSHQNP